MQVLYKSHPPSQNQVYQQKTCLLAVSYNRAAINETTYLNFNIIVRTTGHVAMFALCICG